MTDRIIRNNAGVASITFYNGSTPIDADGSVSYVLKRPDGTTVASGTATKPASTTGIYQIIVPAQAALTRLTVTWTCTIGSLAVTETSTVEIVGGFYFTLAELRAFEANLTPQKFSDARLAAAREEVESEFEQIMGQAWVARYERERGLAVNEDGQLRLKWPFLTAINSLTVDGVDRLDLVDDGLVVLDSSNDMVLDFYEMDLYGSVDIEYEHGNTQVPYKVKTAALKRARGILLGQNARIDERATLMSLPDFGTFSLATPGQRGSWVGIPDIDVVLDNYMHGSRKGAF